MKNLKIDFEDQFENMVDPQTAGALAQAGTQIIGGAIQRRQQRELSKSEIEKLIDSTCGKKPVVKRVLGKNTKAYNDYLSCSSKITSEQADLQRRALAIQEQQLGNASISESGDEGGMSTGAKIGIGIGALAVISVITYLIIKK
jgi:hypothetical protein